MKHLVKVLYGPTASGKTTAALEYAKNQDIIIINADAMQCYKDLPILTAQPTPEEQQQAPHELYGVIDGSKNIIVTTWCYLALEKIETAIKQNKLPILVGGTGFYLKALMEGLSNIPGIPEDVRARGEAILEQDGIQSLINDLTQHNPTDLEKIDIQNPRRVLRAWEVLQHTGRSLQDWQRAHPTKPPEHLTFELDFITRPREELITRINKRFDLMMKEDVLAEVKELSERIDKKEIPEDNLIIKAHGFRPLRAYLKGELSKNDAVEQSKTETRQYAKRQMTWARQQFGLQ